MKKVELFSLENNEITSKTLFSYPLTKEEHPLINIYDIENSKILGFGGAITEASAYNYSLLSDENKRKALELLFGENGLKYRLLRICIGSSDFTLDEYSYLDNSGSFSIERDKKYIIPFIKDINKFTNNECKFLASPWSPPKTMKTNNDRVRGGKLKKECYEEYANYLIDFLSSYRKEGIEISYLTIQNEPKATQTWESCVFDLEDEIEFAKLLKPLLKENGFNINLLAWDHNKERLISRGYEALKTNLFEGIGYHWYSGDHFDAIELIRRMNKDTILLETEFCRSVVEDYVDSKYCLEYLNNIAKGSNGLIEWNVILDENGGPYHNRKGGCDAPIKFNSLTKEIAKSTYYNEVFMFTNFIDVGSTSLFTSSFSEDIKVSAVRKGNKVVINLFNKGKTQVAKVCYKDELIDLEIGNNTLLTLIVNN